MGAALNPAVLLLLLACVVASSKLTKMTKFHGMDSLSSLNEDMPVVSLKMGSNLNPDDIKEGDDVYFECNIRANPKSYKLAWFHNGREIHNNLRAGVIISGQSLVLQRVTRHTGGDYTCMAANTEGKGTSNPVMLKVMFVPTCKEDREELFGALKHETVALRCEVDSNPSLVTFHWTFNNSGDLTEVPSHRHTTTGVVSRLNYTPVSDMDYGTLSCWGANAVGRQRAPCVFQVVAAGNSASLPMNPVLTGLIATAIGLTIVVCVVMVALYHRHKARRHPRDIKHNQLEMTEDAVDDAPGINTPLNPGSVVGIIVGDHRKTEETDPDNYIKGGQ